MKSSTRRIGNVIDSAETAERARLALSQVGLSDVAEARPSTLSGGMKQRVAIARLLAMGSEVMLMDEPFSALDELTRSALDESMRRLWKKEGRTIAFVTHSISEAVLVSGGQNHCVRHPQHFRSGPRVFPHRAVLIVARSYLSGVVRWR